MADARITDLVRRATTHDGSSEGLRASGEAMDQLARLPPGDDGSFVALVRADGGIVAIELRAEDGSVVETLWRKGAVS